MPLETPCAGRDEAMPSHPRLHGLPGTLTGEHRDTLMNGGVTVKPVLDRLAPGAVVRRLAVGLDRRLIPVYLVQINRVRLLGILEHVKPQAPRLVIRGATGVTQHGFHK